MAVFLCNLLGPLCTTYRFDDGSLMRRSSRESITLERGEQHFNVEFLYDRTNGRYLYYLPKDLAEVDRVDLVRKIEEYGQKKRLNIVSEEQS